MKMFFFFIWLLRDDTPLWKCKAVLKLGGRSPGLYQWLTGAFPPINRPLRARRALSFIQQCSVENQKGAIAILFLLQQ